MSIKPVRLDHFGLIYRYYDRGLLYLGAGRLISLLQAQPSERILDIDGSGER